MTKDAHEWILVNSESCDWYVIPVDMIEEFRKWDLDATEYGDNPPKWAKYVQDPGHVVFTGWRCTL